MTRLLLALAALALLLAATNEWTGWEEGIALLEASDVRSYEAIAAAAPDLPAADLPAQHARRFAPHWALGAAADATGIDVHALYRLAWAALVVAVVAAFHLMLTALRAGRAAYWLAMTSLVANAYAFRYYAIAPGVLADLVLVAGLAWSLYGLVARRFGIVAAGLVVGAIGRESLIPLLPVVVAWLALAPGWRELAPRRRAALAAAAAACVLVPYLVLRLVSDPFAHPDTLGLSDFTGTPETPPPLGDLLLITSPGGASELAEHALRVLAPHIVALALLAVLLWRVRLPPRRLPPAFWLGMATWALLAAQPLGLSPEYAADNQTRLSAIALVPLLLALGAIASAARLPEPRPWRGVLAGALLVVASLHHLYATIGPSSATQFVALEAAAAVALAGLVAAHAHRGSTDAAAAVRRGRA